MLKIFCKPRSEDLNLQNCTVNSRYLTSAPLMHMSVHRYLIFLHTRRNNIMTLNLEVRRISELLFKNPPLSRIASVTSLTNWPLHFCICFDSSAYSHIFVRKLNLLGKFLLYMIHSLPSKKTSTHWFSSDCTVLQPASVKLGPHRCHSLDQSSSESQDSRGPWETQQWCSGLACWQGGWLGSRTAPWLSRAIAPVSGGSTRTRGRVFQCPRPGHLPTTHHRFLCLCFVTGRSCKSLTWLPGSEGSVLGLIPWGANVQLCTPAGCGQPGAGALVAGPL